MWLPFFDCHAEMGTHKGYPYALWLFKMPYGLDENLYVFLVDFVAENKISEKRIEYDGYT